MLTLTLAIHTVIVTNFHAKADSEESNDAHPVSKPILTNRTHFRMGYDTTLHIKHLNYLKSQNQFKNTEHASPWNTMLQYINHH